MGRGGRRDREERLTNRKAGQWATSSQDFLFVASKLYACRQGKRKTPKMGIGLATYTPEYHSSWRPPRFHCGIREHAPTQVRVGSN
jgi:hypothetical protein